MFYFQAWSHFIVDQRHGFLFGKSQELHAVDVLLSKVVDKIGTFIDLKKKIKHPDWADNKHVENLKESCNILDRPLRWFQILISWSWRHIPCRIQESRNIFYLFFNFLILDCFIIGLPFNICVIFCATLFLLFIVFCLRLNNWNFRFQDWRSWCWAPRLKFKIFLDKKHWKQMYRELILIQPLVQPLEFDLLFSSEISPQISCFLLVSVSSSPPSSWVASSSWAPRACGRPARTSPPGTCPRSRSPSTGRSPPPTRQSEPWAASRPPWRPCWHRPAAGPSGPCTPTSSPVGNCGRCFPCGWTEPWEQPRFWYFSNIQPNWNLQQSQLHKSGN